MSRTDKTTPTRVQVAAGDRNYTAMHSRDCMADGKCTLPDKPTGEHPTSAEPPPEYRLYLWKRSNGMLRYYLSRKAICYWYPDPYIGKHGQIKSDCGCKQCSMQAERKRNSRRRRQREKKIIREQLEDQ